MAKDPQLRTTTYAEHLDKLRRACEWFDITQGRAALLTRLFEEWTTLEARTPRHLLAYHESCEIIDLHELWRDRVEDFPDLKAHIQIALNKGSVLREEEVTASSSNRARNDAFVYFTAGKLLSVGVSVVAVDGIATDRAVSASKTDIMIQHEASCFNIECKRPQKLKRLQARVKDARRQIKNRGRAPGIVAIDCSVICREGHTVYGNASPAEASSAVLRWIEAHALRQVRPLLTSQILGCMFFARFPAMTPVYDGAPALKHRSDCITSWLMYKHSNHKDAEILRELSKRLQRDQAQAGFTAAK